MCDIDGMDAGDKPELRRRMRMVRELIDDRLMRSVQLWAEVAELAEYRDATFVMAFVGMPGEPDTDPLVARLERDGKTLVLPRIVGSELQPALAGATLRPGQLRIPEPTGDVVERADISLVIVPGLAFTIDGCRLGQGKAYYDRFLVGMTAPTIGVCFAEQLVDTLPMEPHDVRLQRVIAG